MSYSGRVRFRTMREKNQRAKKRLFSIALAAVIAIGLYVAFNWVSIRDYLATYFY